MHPQAMHQQAMTIGRVAARAGVNIQTIRYYERRGLLPAPPRTESNYRMYSGEAVRTVRFVKRAQQLGFTLEEIRQLLALRLDEGATCADVRAQAVDKIADIEDRIRSLRAMKKVLVRLTTVCSGSGSLAGCPILESLEKED